MKHSLNDTIAAIATPQGAGGIGIIRLSGERALDLAEGIMINLPSRENIITHKLYYANAVKAEGGPIDKVLISYMKAPHSYTGEDVVEISAHGGNFILNQIITQLIFKGARLAEKGEFTKRAFLNGKMDLTQAEAVVDLISAETDNARTAAYNQLEGHLAANIRALKGKVVDLVSRIEAEIDFPEDVQEIKQEEITRGCREAESEAVKLLATADQGKIMRSGIRTAIVGKPNVGKSSLFNRLLGQERAIITHLPGTTRDTLEESVGIKGYQFVLIDSAGIRHSLDHTEKIGVERARKEIGEADLILIIFDASEEASEEDISMLEETRGKKRILILNKSDLPRRIKIKGAGEKEGACEVSAKTGEGIEEMKDRMVKIYQSQENKSDGRFCINERHKQALERARKSLGQAIEASQGDSAKDLLTIDLKNAIKALGEITGEEASEEVIQNIFNKFCIGK